MIIPTKKDNNERVLETCAAILERNYVNFIYIRRQNF